MLAPRCTEGARPLGSGARHLGWGLRGALGVDPAVTAPAASANVLEGASGATGNAVFPRAGAPARGLPTPGTQQQARQAQLLIHFVASVEAQST